MATEIQCTVCGRTESVVGLADGAHHVCAACAAAQTLAGAGTIAGDADGTVRELAGAAPVIEPVKARFGHYDIVAEISRGGVGIVYKARQQGLNRLVALKVLQGGVAASSQQVQRFMHEAQSAAKLQHPHIVPIHEFGIEDGQHFFTMDYIEGDSLADMIARGPIQPREALEIVRQVAEALAYAHEQGVIHRDIKPGNILLDRSGRVKVTDFGLAKEVDRGEMHLTMSGQVMGTPRYMSPEQASGRTAEADARSDIFSLGVTLYEMLTGRPAFDAENVVQMLRKILTEEPPPPHKVNNKVHRDIETICLKAIEKAPERRYQNALDLTQDIERFLAGEPIEAKPVGVIGRAGRKVRRHGKVLAAYAAVLFVTFNGLLLYLNTRPSFLRLNVATADSFVVVDGATPDPQELPKGLQLGAGKHTLHVENEPRYEPQNFTFDLKPGESRTMSVALQRRKATLMVTTDPPDAGVTIAGLDGFRATFQGPTVQQELPTGEYSLLAHKENYLAQDRPVNLTASQVVTLNFSLLPITLWSVPTSGNVLSVPVVAHFEDARTSDVVVGDDDGKIYCFSGRNGIALWVFRTQGAVLAPLGKADMTGDGFPDVIAGSTDRHIYCLNGKNGARLWSFETKGPIVGPSLLKDVDGDGVPDVFTGSDDGTLYAISGRTGQALWKFPTTGRINSCLAWAREGDADVILVGSLDKWLYCLQPATGQLLWKVEVGVPLLYPPRIEDLDQNGTLVALLPTPQNPTDARTHAAVSLADHKLQGVSDTFPRWADLDGDGKPKKLVVTANRTTCYAHEGTTVLWDSPYLAVDPYLADVNGDGTQDLIFSNGPQQLLCLSGRDGQVLGRITMEAAIGRGYALDDVDGDGIPDVAVGAGRKLYCFSWTGGRKRWQANAESYFDAAFVALDGKAFTKSVDGEIACYDPEQRLPLWKVRTAPQPSPYAGVAAGHGLVVDANPTTRHLTAWTAAEGKLKWSVRLGGEADSPIGWPAIVGDAVIAGDGASNLWCLALADGARRWQLALPKVIAPAAGDSNMVFIADGANSLHAVTLREGQPRWAYTVSDPYPGPPAVVDINGDGVNDVVALSDNGLIYALDGRSGTLLWDYQLATVRTRTRNRIVLADLDGDGFPEGVVCSVTGDLVCLDLKTGKPKWSFALGEQVMSEPAIADMNGDGIPDVVVGTMGRRLHCISGKGDRELWSYEVGAQIRYSVPLLIKSGPATRAPVVLVGTGPPENGLYCLAGGGPRPNQREWSGPWKMVVSSR